jgi:hypothetical protein
MGVVQANKAAKQATQDRVAQEARMTQQEEEAKTVSRESQRLDQVKTDAGADIEIGTDAGSSSKSRRRARSPRSTAIAAPSAGQVSFGL